MYDLEKLIHSMRVAQIEENEESYQRVVQKCFPLMEKYACAR